MRVAFIAHSSLCSGTEAALMEAVGALRVRGVDARVVLPGSGPLRQRLSRAGVPVAVIPYTWWMGRGNGVVRKVVKAMWTLALVPPLAWRLYRWRPDVIVSWSITIVAGALAASVLRRRHVWALHEAGLRHHELTFDWGHAISRRVIRSTADGVIAASQAAAAEWAVLLDLDARVLYQSVTARGPAEQAQGQIRSLNDRQPPPRTREHPARFVVIGGGAPGKAVHEAVRAVAASPLRSLAVRLTVLGSIEGEDGETLRSLASSLGVAEHVEFAGWVHDLGAVLTGATALVAPSRHEGFGRAVVEGMLAGLPVIGARSGATPELLSHGETGLLYEPGDVGALANLMAQVVADPVEAGLLGERARLAAQERFGRERFGRELEAVLKEVAA